MSVEPVSKSNFRKDINGLRALAVISVTFYHFGLSGFKGGFVGVDIFFVISGFLMTGIVINELELNGDFSIRTFYLSRVRRIFPALIALCAVLLVLGCFFLTWVDYKPLSKQVFTSLTFFSNISFWREAGYFDSASHEKWLLHTWSLSIEWQFYLMLPLLLLAIWKLYPGRIAIERIFLLGFILSFGFSIYLSPLHPTASFYLLHTRAWEMLGGGLVYIYSDKVNFSSRQQTAIEAIGCGVLVFSIVFFESSMRWPGFGASLPVVGAGLLLLNKRFNSLIFGNAVAQWLGTRSYSIYLWHWPIVVALFFLQLKDSVMWISIGLLLSLVLGHLSYLWVEGLFRKKSTDFQYISRASSLILMSTIIIALSLGVYFNNGFSGRFSSAIELIAD